MTRARPHAAQAPKKEKCFACEKLLANCIQTGCGPICVPCFDDTDAADWEPVDEK